MLFRATERVSMANLEDCNNYSKGISILDQFLLVEDLISGNDQQRSFKGKKKVIIQLSIKERENYWLKSNF